MSSVNTVVIQLALDEPKALDRLLDRLNQYLEERNHLGNKFEYVDSCKSAGTKYPNKKLIWGGLNYLNTEEFIELFRSLDIMFSIMTIFNSDGDLCTVIPSRDLVVEVIK